MTSAIPPSEPKAVVRAARNKCAETQGTFAKRLCRCQGEISKYESGKVNPPGDVIMHCMNILRSNEPPPPVHSSTEEEDPPLPEKLGQSSPVTRESHVSRQTPQISEPKTDAWSTVDQAMQQLAQALAAARMPPQTIPASRVPAPSTPLSSTPTGNLGEPE